MAYVAIPPASPGESVQLVTDALTANITQAQADIGTLKGGGTPGGSGLNGLTGTYLSTGYSSLAAWIQAIPAGGTGTLIGKYTVTSTLPTPAKGVTLLGVGNGKGNTAPAGASVIVFNPSSANDILFDSPAYCSFKNIQFYLTGSNGPSARAFEVNGTFCNYWQDCCFQGDHDGTSNNDAWTSGSWGTGIHFTGNAGDSQIRDCWFLNLGRCIVAESIQNYVNGGKIGNSWISVDVPGGNGGLNVSNLTFLGQGGSTDIGTSNSGTLVHFRINGGSGQSNIHQCWFEGAQYAIQVLTAPSQFSVTQSKVSGNLKCLMIHAGSNVLLEALNVGQGPSAAAAKGSFDVTVPCIVQGITSNTGGDQQFSGGKVLASNSAGAVFPSGSILEGRAV